MQKQLITVVGLIVSLGVVALGVSLIAAPLYLQSLATDQQTATVAATNAIYETQVDKLRIESERQSEIDASLATLRSQIPSLPQLDSVFEVIGRAAESTGASIQEITAGETSTFEARTGEESLDETAPSAESSQDGENADSSPAPSAGPTEPNLDSSDADGQTLDGGSSAIGRQQIDFSIRVVAADMNQATAFLDSLRSGPRLLNSVTAITGTEPSGTITLRVTALTYVDVEVAGSE